jgi:hypothetical protein
MAGFTRLGKVLTQGIVNAVFDHIETEIALRSGMGVVSGFALTIGTGLSVDIASGVMVGKKIKSITASSAVGLTPSSTLYIFVDEDGSVLSQVSSSSPGGTYVCVGSCVTGVSTVTSVSTDGKILLPRMTGYREYSIGENLLVVDLMNRRVGIGKVPTEDVDIDGTVNLDGNMHVPTGSVRASAVKGFEAPLSFGYLSKNVAGAVDVTLTDTESENGVIEFVGVLTGNISVIIPNTSGQTKKLVNSTTGAFTLSVKHSGGTAYTITQGHVFDCYSDGTRYYGTTAAKVS